MHHSLFRNVLAVAAALLLIGTLGACGEKRSAGSAKPPTTIARPVTPTVPPSLPTPSPAFDELRRRYGARLGLYALDTGTGREIGFHADDRFA